MAATSLNSSERAEINRAGAEVLEQKLKEAVEAKHNRTGGMAGSVGIDTEPTGASKVGFDKDHAYIARFLNDGTKHIIADHFVDQTREAAKDAIFAAQVKAYRRILRRKGVK